MKEIIIDNMILHATGDKQPQVLFVHGIGDSKERFHQTAKSLLKYNICSIIFDLPGCGDNKQVKFTPDIINTVIKSLFNMNIVRPPLTIVAHSFGGLLTANALVNGQISKFNCSTILVEASLTSVDQDFFNLIHCTTEPNSLEILRKLCLKEDETTPFDYIIAIEKWDDQAFKRSVNFALSTFSDSVSVYLEDLPNCTYIYGGKGRPKERLRHLQNKRNIILYEFKNSWHWPMTNEPKHFTDFIKTHLTVARYDQTSHNSSE